MRLWTLLLAVMSAVVMATATTNPIQELTDSNITIISQDLWLVEYFSASCPHCQAFAPIFEQYAVSQAQNSTLSIGKFECSNNVQLCQKAGVNLLPTMKM